MGRVLCRPVTEFPPGTPKGTRVRLGRVPRPPLPGSSWGTGSRTGASEESDRREGKAADCGLR